MSNLSRKIKIKNPDLSNRIFDVDRGGVPACQRLKAQPMAGREPLKQSDESAPGTLRTRPSDPQKYISKYLYKRKSPYK